MYKKYNLELESILKYSTCTKNRKKFSIVKTFLTEG